MALISPSICGLRRLVAICEAYAVTHGLKYRKSELDMFKLGAIKYEEFSSVSLFVWLTTKVGQVFQILGSFIGQRT